MNIKTEQIEAALFGVAVGDALGVPVEFTSRKTLKLWPVTGMSGNGTHNQPAGTWSDDSSLTFCLAEALTHAFSMDRIAANFVAWKQECYWTAGGAVFDIGITTREAISNLIKGRKPELAGGYYEDENGNGSLMRILPLLFYITDKSIDDRYLITKQVSSITHGHPRSVIACFYYLEFARLLMSGADKYDVYTQVKTIVKQQLRKLRINAAEVAVFRRLLEDDITLTEEDRIHSTGYVLDTLEASIWCLLTTDNYEAAVLKAVNLGDDTDTTGAVCGGLAGLYYGLQNIPAAWRAGIKRSADIENLAIRLAAQLPDADAVEREQ